MDSEVDSATVSSAGTSLDADSAAEAADSSVPDAPSVSAVRRERSGMAPRLGVGAAVLRAEGTSAAASAPVTRPRWGRVLPGWRDGRPVADSRAAIDEPGWRVGRPITVAVAAGSPEVDSSSSASSAGSTGSGASSVTISGTKGACSGSVPSSRVGSTSAGASGMDGAPSRSADSGTNTVAVMPDAALVARATSMPWRLARRLTTNRPMRRAVSGVTSAPDSRVSLIWRSDSSGMPRPESLTSMVRPPGAGAVDSVTLVDGEE